MATLIDHVWEHLIAEGIGRDPRAGGDLPPVWREPESGVPAPGEPADAAGDRALEVGQDAVIGLFGGGGIPPGKGEGYSRKDTIDFWLRTKVAADAHELEEQLRQQFAPADLGYRQDWSLAGLQVIESRMWRPMGPPLDSDPAQGFTFTVSHLFETYA